MNPSNYDNLLVNRDPSEDLRIDSDEAKPIPAFLNHVRLCIVESVYHQDTTDQPKGIHILNEQVLNSDEPPVHLPKRKATKQWQEINLQWLSDLPLSQLVICNDEGKFLQTLPTKEQLEESAKKILEVRFSKPNYYETYDDDPHILIPPQMSNRVCPFSKVYIRSQYGMTLYTIFATAR